MESGSSESGAMEMFRRQCRVETPVWNLLTLNPAVSHRVCSLHARSLPVSPTGRRTRLNAPPASVPLQVQTVKKRKNLSGKNVLSQAQRRASRARKSMHAD